MIGIQRQRDATMAALQFTIIDKMSDTPLHDIC